MHDRDVNAARNVLCEGRRIVAAGRKPAAATRREAETQNACGAQVRPGLLPAQRATPISVGKKQEPTQTVT